MTVVEQTTTTTEIPAGTWRADPVHSSAAFSVRHTLVATFRGEFTRVEATLVSAEGAAELTGRVPVESVAVKDENLTGHLHSPEFFDAERHPELLFRSTSIRRDGDAVRIAGELSVKGITRPVDVRGRIAGPVDDPWGGQRLALDLETTVDRNEFDLRWNAPLPGGGFLLGDEVTLTVHLSLIRHGE